MKRNVLALLIFVTQEKNETQTEIESKTKEIDQTEERNIEFSLSPLSICHPERIEEREEGILCKNRSSKKITQLKAESEIFIASLTVHRACVEVFRHQNRCVEAHLFDAVHG